MYEKILPYEKAMQINNILFSTFIDSSSYEKQQEYNKSFYLEYGISLSTCLWNCLSIEPKRTSQYAAICYLENVNQRLFVIEDAGKPTKGGLIESGSFYPVFVVPAKHRNELFSFISSHDITDIYVFDDSFDWLLIFTHEEIKAGRRYCLLVSHSKSTGSPGGSTVCK